MVCEFWGVVEMAFLAEVGVVSFGWGEPEDVCVGVDSVRFELGCQSVSQLFFDVEFDGDTAFDGVGVEETGGSSVDGGLEECVCVLRRAVGFLEEWDEGERNGTRRGCCKILGGCCEIF